MKSAQSARKRESPNPRCVCFVEMARVFKTYHKARLNETLVNLFFFVLFFFQTIISNSTKGPIIIHPLGGGLRRIFGGSHGFSGERKEVSHH